MSSFAAVTILALACLAMANAELYSAQFSNWAVEHGKTYANDASYQAALSAFSTHEDTIRAHPADASYVWPAIAAWTPPRAPPSLSPYGPPPHP